MREAAVQLALADCCHLRCHGILQPGWGIYDGLRRQNPCVKGARGDSGARRPPSWATPDSNEPKPRFQLLIPAA